MATVATTFQSSTSWGLFTTALLAALFAGCEEYTCVDTATCTYAADDAGPGMQVDVDSAPVEAGVSEERTTVAASLEAGAGSETFSTESADTEGPSTDTDTSGFGQSSSPNATDSGGPSQSSWGMTTTSSSDISSETGETENQCQTPLSACGDDCINLSSDTANCGTCGRDCLGEACEDGQCKPLEIGTMEDSPSDLTIRGSFIYSLNSSNGWSIFRLPTTGGEPVQVGWTFRELSRIITDEAYHYSFYFETDMTVGRSPIVTTPMGRSTFSAIGDPSSFPSPVPGMEASDSHLYFVFSAATKSLSRIAKVEGQLGFVSGSENLNLKSFGVDQNFIFDLGSKVLSKLPVEGGSVSPVTSANEDELFSELELTADDVIVASNKRIATMPKDGNGLQTLVELDGVYLLEADSHGSSFVFVQRLGDATSCSGGSVIYEGVGGAAFPLTTLSGSCVSHVVFDGDAVYWTKVDSPAVFKVTRR